MERCTIELHNADCMDVIARYPDGYFDLAIVDPPYGISKDGNKKTTGGNGGRKEHTKKHWDCKKGRPSGIYFAALQKKCSNQIIWGANYFCNFLQPSMGWVVWDKGQRIDQSDGELAYTSFNRALRIFTMNRVELLKEGTIHPTQKPVELYKWLYANYAKPGMKILDTHLGSGSNAIAAYDMDMALFVGCELDADYYAAAKARIDQHCNQQRLF